jgi:hypothetical protein
MRCYRCGAPAKRKPFINPHILPFMVASFQAEQRYDSLLMVQVMMISDGAVDYQRHVKPFLNEGPYLLDALPYHKAVDTGLYLCKFCGMAVPDGEECSGCGGPRSPWQELIELDRTCLYCGTSVQGGIICPGCSARIRGTVFSQAFPEKVVK